MGTELIRLIDRHIGRGKQVTVDLRHYVVMVYRTRWLKPMEWLEQYPEKAMALWGFFHPETAPSADVEDDPDAP
jgi:hypothetical protein